jgi:hypothetical protein
MTQGQPATAALIVAGTFAGHLKKCLLARALRDFKGS